MKTIAEIAAMRRPLSMPKGKVALLCVDLQEEHRGDERYLCFDYERVLANAALLQEAARAAGVAVLHSVYVADAAAIAASGRLHPTTPDGRSAFSDKSDPLTAICPEVAPQDGEVVFEKDEASAFGDGRLAGHLRATGVEWIVVSGVWTEACIDLTVRDAVAAGVHVLLVKDACGSGTTTMHRTAVLNLANRLYGGAVCDTATAVRLLAAETVPAWSPAMPVAIRYEADTIDAFYEAL